MSDFDERTVPYLVYESTIARLERTIRRLIIVVILAVILLAATNALWLYEWTQYDYSSVEINTEDGGDSSYLKAGANGIINNVKNSSQDENETE